MKTKFQIKQNSQGQFCLECHRKNIVIKNQKIIRKIEQEFAENKQNYHNMYLCRMIIASNNIKEKNVLQIRKKLLNYAENDILYYYIEDPKEIYLKQKKLWPKIINYIEQKIQTKLPNTNDFYLEKLNSNIINFFQNWLNKQNKLKIIPLQQIITISNSIIVTVNLCDKNINVEEAWEAVNLEFQHNQKKWGIDKNARQQYLKNKKEFFSAYDLFENTISLE